MTRAIPYTFVVPGIPLDFQRALRAIVLLTCALTAHGCSSPKAADSHEQSAAPASDPLAVDPLAVAPADFTIDLTVLTGRAIERDVRNAVLENRAEPEMLVVEREQSRLVLLADGALYYGTDPNLGTDWLPPWSRRLSREQVAELWRLTKQLGFDDPAAGDAIGNIDQVTCGPDEIVHILALTGDGRRWLFVRRTPSDQEPDAATTTMVRRMAALAWASDGHTAEVIMLPTRYDFGPDPYAPFRRKPLVTQ